MPVVMGKGGANLMGPIFDKAMRAGNGYMLIGPPDTEYDDVPNWQEVGAVAGNGVIHPAPVVKELKGGYPEAIGAISRGEEGYTVEWECVEITLPQILFKYGYDWTAIENEQPAGFPTTGDTIAVTAERKILYGYNWFHLQNTNIQTPVVAEAQEATPVELQIYDPENPEAGGDIQIDYLRGRVRRIPGGVSTSGVAIDFDYSYISSPQGINRYSIGLNSDVATYPFQFVVPQDATTRLIFKGYKAYAKAGEGQTYGTDFWRAKITLMGMMSFRRLPDDCISGWEEEVYYYATPTP
jgi:hypothetical protein